MVRVKRERNPSQSPFAKGRGGLFPSGKGEIYCSPFEKGGLRGIFFLALTGW